jgi:hypothetical protein
VDRAQVPRKSNQYPERSGSSICLSRSLITPFRRPARASTADPPGSWIRLLPPSIVLIFVCVAFQLIELITQGPDTNPEHLSGLGAVAFCLAERMHDVFAFD